MAIFRNSDEEPYIPKFVTTEEANETKTSTKVDIDVDTEIWDLSERSNKNNPRQELGNAGQVVKFPEGCPHATAAKIEL